MYCHDSEGIICPTGGEAPVCRADADRPVLELSSKTAARAPWWKSYGFKTLVSHSTSTWPGWPSFTEWKLAGSPLIIFCPQREMARYLFRNCPRCAGYLGIVLREPGRNTPLQAVNGHCLKCDYRLARIVVREGAEELRLRWRWANWWILRSSRI